ncbi:MAG: hypothetical protein JNM56_12485 [Planctomycetia bacterium]|nr:hypothetical protein [Planctomycetia bacterium]
MADNSEREAGSRPSPTAPADSPPPWEQIEAGRYQPRRIKGSFPGRELG